MSNSKVKFTVKGVMDQLALDVDKILQDLAYATYAHNIRVSNELDAIFASCPGYLRRSHE